MAYAFPDRSTAPQPVDPVEVINSYVLDHLVACARKGQFNGQLYNPQGVAIHPTTNHIYVAEGSAIYGFARVSIFSEAGEFLNSYTHEDMKSLYGIAIHGDNLYVTDSELHCVFHIKIGDKFRLVGRMGGRGAGVGQFNYIRQLSISTNGDLYLADCGNNRVQILDSSLYPMREITHPSMHEPCDVKLTTDHIYVLSDQDNPCVHVFSYAGHKIRSLITGGKRMQVTKPYCFCLDDRNSLIISDWKTDQIKIFLNDGTYLHTLGRWGNSIARFIGPKGLAITQNHKLVTVSQNLNVGIQIFASL